MTRYGSFQKGLGTLSTPAEIAAIRDRGWNVLREDLSLPAAVLMESRLEHNLRWMAEFARRYGVQLAPHGKTTMAPGLFRRQLDAGAWGITLATAHQCGVAHNHGVRRILMANELVGRANCELVSTLLAQGTTLYTLVDSAALVHQLGAFFSSRGQQLRVLLEVGVLGGRTGTRTASQVQDILTALTRWRGTLLLCGVEVYEGVLQDEASVRAYLTHALATFTTLQEQNSFAAEEERPLLSGAGSAWFDIVADIFAPMRTRAEILLRPGCYLTCDAGLYRSAQQQITDRNTIAREIDARFGGTLRSALEIWAYVQSVPEPGHAIVGLGKRDAAFDAGLPTPVWHFRPGMHPRPQAIAAGWSTTKLMDQHGYLAFPKDAEVQVGDMVAFAISHPCLTFDKWRYMPLVNDEYDVVDIVETFF